MNGLGNRYLQAAPRARPAIASGLERNDSLENECDGRADDLGKRYQPLPAVRHLAGEAEGTAPR